jgi:hypothetical protein
LDGFRITNNHFLTDCSAGGGEAADQPLTNAHAAEVELEIFTAAPEGNVSSVFLSLYFRSLLVLNCSFEEF